MKLVVDENLPPKLVSWLNAKRCDAIHVISLGLRGADDSMVWQAAQDRGAMVISHDSDFIDRAARSSVGGAIRLTIGNCTTLQLLEWLEPRWGTILARVAAGERAIEV